MEKIVIFTPTLNIGGIERVLLTYAKGLSRKGYDVIYLTCGGKGHFEPETYKNVQFVNLNVERLRQSLFSLIAFLKKTKPDIIFTANDSTLIIYLAKLLSGVSTKIITSHHNYYENNEEVGLRQKLTIKYIYPLCHKVVAVSNGIHDMLIDTFKLKSNKVVTIYNPVDIKEILTLAEMPLDDSYEKYILYVGRLSVVKNLPLLFNSFNIFKKYYPNIKLIVIGDGEDIGTICNTIKQLSLEDSILLLGVKSNPFPYIKNAEIVVLPSKTEALPTILLESLTLGKTIISTPTSGAKDILKNGMLGYISKSLYGVDDFSEALKKGYENRLDNDLLFKSIEEEYCLDTKIMEFENLWKCNHD